jgi:hypothetical protein
LTWWRSGRLLTGAGGARRAPSGPPPGAPQ